MSSNSIGSSSSMPSIGNLNQQSAIQYVNNPLQSPQIQAASVQNSPSQHSPMGTQSQVSGKVMQGGVDQLSTLLTKSRLYDLVREVDPTVQLDEEVEDLLLQLADDFIDTSVGSSSLFAKHRHVAVVDVRDVQLLLERQWNMWIPGFGNEELRPYKRAAVTEAHKQRMALIRKNSKKY